MDHDSKSSRKRRAPGRPSADSGAREAILDAALELFAAHGYEGATMRAIAAAAKVDTGLIRHYFSDKYSLFLNTVADRTAMIEHLARALQAPAESLGSNLAEAYLALWEDEESGPILTALSRSAISGGHGGDLLMEIVGGRLRDIADVPYPDDPRATGFGLAMAHLFGVAMARHVLQVPQLVAPSRRELVKHIGPTIQMYFEAK